MKRVLFLLLLMTTMVFNGMAQNIGEAFYVYRNDGQFNAFFCEDVLSMEYSYEDADGNEYDEIVTQIINTTDSVYKIPLAVIDSVAFRVNDIIVSQDYLSVSEDNYSIVSANPEGGSYVLQFQGTLPNYTAGNIITIIGEDIAELVRIQSVHYSGQQVSITAEPASLGDVFTRGSFTLTSEKMDFSRSRFYYSDNNRVFYPVEVTYYDDNNQQHRIRSKSPNKIEFEQNLYHYTIDYSGYDFYKNDYLRFYLESCCLDFDIDLVICCNFNSIEEAIDKKHKGELAIQKSVVRGKVDTDFMLRLDANGSKGVKLEEVMLKKNIHKPIYAKFVVSGVPIVVVMNTHLLAEGNYSMEGNFSAYTGFTTSTSAELGCSWSQASGLKPYASFNNSFQMHNPTIEGSAHLEGKLSVFPRVTFSLYGLIGPSFDIKPYCRNTLDIGFFDDLIASGEKDFYGVNYNMFIGYDAAVGLSTLSVTGNSPFIKSPSWNVAEGHLYEAPKKIEFEKASSEVAIANQPIEVAFRVTDYYPLFNLATNPLLPMAVKFKTNCGTLSRDFAITNLSTGLATINWTPSSITSDGKDPYIIAMMHDYTGREITADRWIPKKAEEKVEVTTLEARDITSSSAILTGQLSCYGNNYPGSVLFYYSKTNDPQTTGTLVNVGNVSDMNAALFSTNLTGLQDNTTYYYVAAYINGTNISYGQVKSFKTPAVSFDVSSIDISDHSVIISGVIPDYNPDMNYRYYVLYSENKEDVENGTNCKDSYIFPSDDGSFSETLKDLLSNTTYYYVIICNTGNNIISGNINSFKTAISFWTDSYLQIGSHEVVLYGYGQVDSTIEYVFYYSKNEDVLNGTKVSASPTSYNPELFEALITGLEDRQMYYYAFAAIQDGETHLGKVFSFITPYDYIQGELCPDGNHPHMIDLGLPSGTKWACCNVGSHLPSEAGGLYAWGETEEKDYSLYTHDGYSYFNWKDGYKNIGDCISGTKYDVATVQWGNGWMMPTIEQIRELLEYCNSEFYCLNVYNVEYKNSESELVSDLEGNVLKENVSKKIQTGYLITGQNGKKIFLGIFGHRNSLNAQNPYGNFHYMTGSVDPESHMSLESGFYPKQSYGCSEYVLSEYREGYYTDNFLTEKKLLRFIGLPVRAVK